MNTIYLIPGLGADSRLFENYRFPGFTTHVLEWITPTKKETLTSYAQRMSKAITEEHCFILGVSFGGMIAVEIGRIKPFARIILLSSVASYQHIPTFTRWTASSGAIRLLPDWLLQNPGRIASWLFGVTTSEGRHMLKEIMGDTPPSFTRWAVSAIGRWRGQSIQNQKLCVHGRSDLVLPSASEVDHLLPGGHFIVFDSSTVINDLILQWMQDN
ncbi:MAG: alpha/beta hydrolase [Bacteroidota bacterium]